jgi:predicted lipid-binding transport protein (Tim44 family)
MRNIAIALFSVVIGFGMFAQEAEAKRLGGGGSFGMNRSSTPVQKAAPAPTTPANTAPSAVPAKPGTPAAAPQPSGMSRWLGPIAGLAAGLGIAALLSHFGMGEGVANFLMIALLVMAAVFLFRRFFGKSQPSQQGSLAPAGNAPLRFEPSESTPIASGSSVAAAAVPTDFDTEGFLRQAKLNFIRLQAANDAGNLDDLKQFLAPEVYAEIQLQYEARGKTKQETDVQQLEAEILEVVTEGNLHVASVRFSGTLREDAGAAAPFAEIWHLVKPISGERGWQVAGIQQIQ